MGSHEAGLTAHGMSSAKLETQWTGRMAPADVKLSGAQNCGSWLLRPSGLCIQRSPVQMNSDDPEGCGTSMTKFCCARIGDAATLGGFALLD